MALDSPCATWKCAPIGRLIPWTRATDAFEKAMPACSEPTILASRAARSPGASQTRRRFGQIDRIAAIAIESENGLARSEEHTTELQSLMRISYAVFCLI